MASKANSLYAVFVNFRAAFNLVANNKLRLTLAETGVSINVANLFAAIIQEDRLTIDNDERFLYIDIYRFYRGYFYPFLA